MGEWVTRLELYWESREKSTNNSTHLLQSYQIPKYDVGFTTIVLKPEHLKNDPLLMVILDWMNWDRNGQNIQTYTNET